MLLNEAGDRCVLRLCIIQVLDNYKSRDKRLPQMHFTIDK